MKSMQHAKTKQLFEADALRLALDRFLLPESCLEQCPALEAFLAPLAFAPTVETIKRTIEGAYKDAWQAL